MRSPIHRVTFALCLVSLAGCQSISSTMLNRLEDNSFAGNSNGEHELCGKTRPYKGVPITLKVPSHMDVFVEEVYYLGLDGDSAVDCLNRDDGNRCRILNIKTEIIKTDKVFIVDFKRPGSGSLKLGLDFNDQQYFDAIRSELEDTTITDAAALAAQVIDSVGAFAAMSASAREPDAGELEILKNNGITREVRTVAYMRFDINAYDFEQQVEGFVNHHLTRCNQGCGTMPLYDQVVQPPTQ